MRHSEEPLHEYPIDALTTVRISAMMRDGSPSRHAHDRDGRLLVGQKLGSYGLIRLINCGESCWIFLARHLARRINVVLKVLDTNFVPPMPAVLRKFREHAHSASLLHHPQIVLTHEEEVCEGIYAVAMEHLTGFTIADLLKVLGRISVTAVTAITGQVTKGLAHLHSLGLVHHQIEPGHIIIGSAGDAKILSLSAIAQPANPAPQQTTILQANPRRPQYHAPEHETLNHGDFRSDLYALGATVFEMLTGAPLTPAYAESRPLLPCRADRISSVRNYGGIGAITERLLAINPEDRYGSHAELLRELDLTQARL